MSHSCPFCDPATIEKIAEHTLAFAFRDRYPVSPGHTLVVTRRHVSDFFGCTADERVALFDLVDRVKADLDANWSRVEKMVRRPDAYNVGFNAGTAAGQTVPHVHIHVIPRFHGDVEDPRGGVRYVIPDKANYLDERAEILPDGDQGGTFYLALAPLLARAAHIDILAAFVQDSGLTAIEPAVREALARGARFRIITGNYLDITQVDALRRLADWAGMNEAERAAEGDALVVTGNLQARVIETKLIGGRAFHPKAWHLRGDDFGVAFVGSSNLSRSALHDGVEWNLRVDRHRDPLAWTRVGKSYERLWRAARVIDADWIDAYARDVQARPRPLPIGEVTEQPPVALPDPTQLQREALDALAATRAENRRRALIVMATGLGKTVLAALDIASIAREAGTSPSVLWLAHRRELLEQAADTLRRGLPEARFASMLGGARPVEPFDVLFASVQTLSRPGTLAHFATDRFEYVVVDEVHHADAPSYRRILAHFSPAFLLGLTATPERADGGDIPGLFDDHIPYRADVGTGISEGLLVPFRYFGLADTTVNYRPIWRGGRFDVEDLSTALGTDARMDKLWSVWNEPAKASSRTMVFCVSIRHAVFVRDWLSARGVRVRLCHGGPGSDDRTAALQDLEGGRIDAICSVDLFNEGIDCRPLDRVVMLRPTESPVLFLQQLGRGLRNAEHKERLIVIDFVGNHEVFLDRVRTLLSLGDSQPSVQAFVARGAARLPPGCTLDFELEAIDLLKRLLPPAGGANALVSAYREIRAARGERPTAGELVRMGFSLGSLLSGHGGWFGFVASEGGLTDAEASILSAGAPWLRVVQTTPMTKCFKMVVLEVLLDADALLAGMEISEIAARSHELLLRSPELFEDLEGVKDLPDPHAPKPAIWEAYWRKNPIDHWCESPWFAVDGTRLRTRLPAVDGDTLSGMTRELVDARLATYRRRRAGGVEAVDAKVSWNKRDPILFLPTGTKRERLPTGDVDVRLPDGAAWRFRFAKVAVNVAHPVGRDRNELPDLLRRWFGAHAGRPGTDFRVRFRPSPDGWWVEPLGEVVTLATDRGRFVAFPTLKAAAGWAGSEAQVSAHVSDDPERYEVRLPGQVSEKQFAVRVAGTSMDGGVRPLRDGDWAIFEWARGLGIGAVEGKVTLVGIGPEDAPDFYIKRVVREAAGYLLRSDNPDVAPRPAANAVPYARLVRPVHPEELAPAEGEVLDDVRAAFGVSSEPNGTIDRVDGHLFLLAEGRDVLTAPDSWSIRVPDRRPGETAYVLARADAESPWRYLGVGRWQADESAWSFRAPSLSAWRAVSSGRTASRTLRRSYAEDAARAAAEAPARMGAAWIESGNQRCRIVGRAPQGGLRINGGDGGFAERTISLLDLGWVLAAEADVQKNGGVLDEARVNRLRYLDGTTKGATRWIDTGWAVAILSALRRNVEIKD
ncbi:MAG: DEAD/DEAH box helicase family protein [Pseudomonadota bacterium]|nr:DEAD/DEAH box helicase family protein [Pseudomonadota bacterium]